MFVTQEDYVIDPAEAPCCVRALAGRRHLGGSGRLTSTSGRVDYPIISASGEHRLRRVHQLQHRCSDSSTQHQRRCDVSGQHQPRHDDSRDDGEGLAAWPISCASGTNSAVAWLKGDGTIKLSVSENSGTSYTTKTINSVNAGGNDEGWAGCDATGSRIGITWNENDGVYYSEYSTATDSFTTPRKNIFPFSGSGYLASYSGTVALSGAGTVGIAAPLCVQDGCDYTTNATRIDLKWLESADNGDNFAAEEAISNATAALSGGKTLNDSPTALFWDADTRFVLYNGWTANYGNYRLYLATGTS